MMMENFTQCHSALEFWRQVPKSKYPELKTTGVRLIFVFNLVYCGEYLFSVIKFVKSENNISSKFSKFSKSNKNLVSIDFKFFMFSTLSDYFFINIALFTVFLLMLQTYFAAHWHLGFPTSKMKEKNNTLTPGLLYFVRNKVIVITVRLLLSFVK